MTRKFLDSSRAWIKLSPPLSSKAPPPTTPKRIQKIKKSFQALTSKLQMTRRVLVNPLKNSFYVSDPSPQTPSTLTTTTTEIQTSSSEAIDVQSGASRTRPFPDPRPEAEVSPSSDDEAEPITQLHFPNPTSTNYLRDKTFQRSLLEQQNFS